MIVDRSPRSGPSPAAGDSSAQYATTAWTQAQMAMLASVVLTASTTLALTQAGKVVEVNASAAATVTVPKNATVAFAVGTVIEIFQYGVGQVTIAAASGVTIRSPGSSLTTRVQFSSVMLRYRGSDEWVLSGDLT